MRRIALLGAAGTGKTRLAGELAGFPVEPTEPADATSARDCDAVLVMGLDLPGTASREAEDAALRAQLQAAGIPYRVVYGTGAQRLQSALQALGLDQRQEDEAAHRNWTWSCEKCSDPDCEHRLFTRLREQRS